MEIVAKILIFIGFFGLITISSVNFYAYKIKGKVGSQPLVPDWWGQWFVIYLIMGSFLLIGVVLFATQVSL